MKCFLQPVERSALIPVSPSGIIDCSLLPGRIDLKADDFSRCAAVA